MEHAQARGRVGDLAHDGGAHLGQARAQTPPAGALHGLQRSALRGQAADVIGLYLNPPAHAAVFCVDEKTAIQSLDRLEPVLPFSPGRIERHGFEYYCDGTLSLYAACLPRRHPRSPAAGKEIPVICDNLSAHKTKAVDTFLSGTPTCICITPRLIRPGSPGRDLVCEGRARCDRTRCLHLGPRSQAKAHALYSSVPRRAQPVNDSTVPRPIASLRIRALQSARGSDPRRSCAGKVSAA
jgi:hypothetical protein